MGFARKRVGKGGKVKYTAAYRDLRGSSVRRGPSPARGPRTRRGRGRSGVAAGRVGDPARGRQTLRKYVEERWPPDDVIEPTTRRSTPTTSAPISSRY